MFSRTLIFDVETTGLIQKTKNIANQPHIIQLSFIIANISKEGSSTVEIVREFDAYIRIDDSVEVSSKITEITGITKDRCVEQGVPIKNALLEFYNEYIKADCIVSHNIAFDSGMILIEFERNYHDMIDIGCDTPYLLFNPMYNHVNHKKIFCTMTEGKELPSFIRTYQPKKITCSSDENATIAPQRTYKKTPKLVELYTYLYPDRPIPQGLHDSLVDTKVCMECYIAMI